MATAIFSSKDQNWQDGSTTYWFVLNGSDYGTGKILSDDMFGIVDCAGEKTVIDADGFPVENEYVATIVLRDCKITDEMINL